MALIPQDENPMSDSPGGSPNKSLDGKMSLTKHSGKTQDDDYKLVFEGDHVNASELLEDGHIEVARISPGACFGELALIDGKPRMATIKCVTRCHFLILDRSRYNKSLRE